MAGRASERDVSDPGVEVRRAGLVDLDVADAGVVVALAERSGALQGGDSCIAPNLRAGRKIDLHVDRLAAAARRIAPPSLRRLDEQTAVGKFDARLLRGGDVGLLGGVGGTYLDDGVAAIARLDPDVADAELQGDEDRVGCLESRHGCSFSSGWRASEPSPCSGRDRMRRGPGGARGRYDPVRSSPRGRAMY